MITKQSWMEPQTLSGDLPYSHPLAGISWALFSILSLSSWPSFMNQLLRDVALVCLGSSVNAWIGEPSLNDVGEFIKPLALSLPRHRDMWLRLAQIPRTVLQVLCPSTHVGCSWKGMPSAGRPSHKHSLSRGTNVCESYVPNIHCSPEAAPILTTCLAFPPSTTTNKKSSFLSVDSTC